MGINLINRAKTIPPTLSKSMILRVGDKNIHQKMLNSRVTVITTPAGYGKTTFMTNFYGEYNNAVIAGSLVKCCWLSLAADDTNPGHFIGDLAWSLNSAIPGFFEQVSSMDSPSALDSFLQVLHCQPQFGVIYMLLDDYHNVAHSEAINQWMATLITRAPANIKFCLASRVKLPYPLRAQTLSPTVVSKEDLAFSKEDGWHLLKDVLGIEIDYKTYAEVFNLIQGWPAALVLGGRSLAAPGARTGANIDFSSREEIWDYFAEEVMSHVNPEVQDLLARASMLEKCTAKACSTIICGQDWEHLLSSAIANGLLISVHYGEEKEYRFHQLLRDYLAKKLQRLDAEHINELHLKAAEYFMATEDAHLALVHLIKAGKNTQVFAFLSQRGQALMYKNIFPSLKKWLGVLSDEYLDAKPELYYFKGYIFQYENPYLAIDCLQKGAAKIPPHNIEYKVRSLIVLSVVYAMQNNYEVVKAIIAEIENITAGANDNPFLAKAQRIMQLLLMFWLDNLAKIDECLLQVRSLPSDVETEFVASLADGVYVFRRGEIVKADQMLEALFSEPFVKDNPLWRGMVLFYHLHVILALGDKDRIESQTNSLAQMGEQFGWPFFVAFASWIKGKYLAYEGEYQKAAGMFQQAAVIFEKLANRPMGEVMKAELILTRSLTGFAGQGYTDIEKVVHTLKSYCPGLWLNEYVLSIAGVIALKAGNLELAKEHLQTAAQVNREKGASYSLAGNLLNLSYLYSQLGDDDGASLYLEEGLGIAAARGYRVFSEWYPEAMEFVGIRAMKKQLYSNYALELLSTGTEDIAGTLLTLALELPEQEQKFLDLASEIYSNNPGKGKVPHLLVRGLGAVELIVNGKLVSDKIWETKKAKELLFFLLLGQGDKTSREQLQEVLWPEKLNPSNALRVTLTRLRKAVSFIGREDILRDEEGFLWASATDHCICDFSVFEAKVKAGCRLAENGQTANAMELLRSAVNMYRGDLLAKEGISADWLEAQREGFRLLYIDAVICHTDIIMNSPRLDRTGLTCARDLLLQAIKVNPFAEEFYYKLFTVFHKLGQPESAANIYRKCKKMLLKEFGISPDERWNKSI